MPVCPSFEKYLLEPLENGLTHGILGDGENGIRKLTLVKVEVIQTKVKLWKMTIFTLEV